MLILHINPNNYVASILRQFQSTSSDSVSILGEISLPDGEGASVNDVLRYLKGLEKLPDLIHIHDITLLTSEKSDQLLRFINDLKIKLVLSLGLEGRTNLSELSKKLSQISIEQIDKNFDLVLVQDGNLLNFCDQLSISSWLPYPVSINVKNGGDFQIPEGEITVQLSYPKPSNEYSRCEEIINELKVAGHQISLIPLSISEEGIINRADILIDRLSGEGYGYLAVLGLASGCTVLSANPMHIRNRSKQLEMSSVLDTNWDNLKTRLVSLLNERRSLRDFSKRSQQYVQNFHRADQIAAELLEMYRQIV